MRVHWLLHGHMAFKHTTVSRQERPQAGNIVKTMMSEGNSSLFTANVDHFNM